MNKLFLVLALLFALSACSVSLGNRCLYTQEGTKISSWVWIYSAGKAEDSTYEGGGVVIDDTNDCESCQ